MDFILRRSDFATADVWKMATKQPAANKSKKLKNHTTNLFGETIGRLHLERQDIEKMGGRKSKALRDADKLVKVEEKALLDGELEKEKGELSAEFKQAYGFSMEE